MMTGKNIQPGDRAPDFSLPVTGGRTLSSDSLSGQAYLLYFYPKAETPGCTVQACDLRDRLSDLSSLGVRVIGVSPDPVPKLEQFMKKEGLNFPLVSDVDHTLADSYGTWVQKSMYGRSYMGMERSSFLVNGKGVICTVWRNVKPADHAALVEQEVKRLGKEALSGA